MIYAPASVWKRLANYLIDRTVIIVIAIFFNIYITFSIGSGITSIVLFYSSGFIVVFVYYILFEMFGQRTLGKYITGTKVVMRDGTKPSFKNILGRTICRFIPFEWITFFIGANPIGWHDRFSGTVVVPKKYTAEDVSKIDFESLKKNSNNTAVVIIVAVLALLLVISIVGILSSVVLASLNVAREKGSDAKVRMNLSSLRANIEVYSAGNNGSYSIAKNCYEGVYKDSLIATIVNETLEAKPICKAENTTFAVSAVLKAEKTGACVDNTGYTGSGVAVSVDGKAYCDKGVSVSINTPISAWQTYSPDSKEFSVLMPSTPQYLTEGDEAGSPFKMEMYISGSGDVSYNVFNYKFANPIDNENQAIMIGGLNGLVSADPKNSIVSQSFGKLGTKDYLDFLVKHDAGFFKGRVILVDKSEMFLVLIDSPIVDEENSKNFIDSFKLN